MLNLYAALAALAYTFVIASPFILLAFLTRRGK